MVSPVPEPGGRRWQRRGLKHSVNVGKVRGPLDGPRDMRGMETVTEALVVRIVTRAGLEPPFGPRAQMARWAGRCV
jgi:hypothetical protein